MTLRIKPVRLNKSIYFRVPNDIADLLGIDQMTEVTLTLEHSSDNSLLIYSVKKSPQDDLENVYRRVKERGEISAAPPRTQTPLSQQ
jgi:antitoxin component of MazEF toxin-antitoxin module